MGEFDDLIPGGAPANAGGAFDDLIPPAKRADPKIGQPEELTWQEKLAQNLPDWMAGTRGNAVGRILKGASDPAVAAAQVVANALPGDAGKNVNTWVADQEKQYQADRSAAGSSGVDLLRAGGGIVATAPLGALGAGVKGAALAGAASGALDPVRDAKDTGDFWLEKAKQTAIGAGAGAALSPLMGALARIVSPNASTDAGLKLLRDEGVETTIGQALGGAANAIEQKATSIPFLGDAISAARRRGVESFDTAALNRAVEPIGGKVSRAGHEGVKDAGDALSAAYEAAAQNVGHINFATPQVVSKLGQLESMVQQGLTADMARKFEGITTNVIQRRMSPNGSIAGADLKKVDSELGQIAANWRGSQNPGDREFGDAVRQLQQIVRDGMADASPAYAAAKAAADQGWRSLVPARKAATAAANNEGVFSPAQLMAAIKAGDKTVGKRATAEGSAWMQDLARAGQRLGTKVPDSGTVGRFANAAGIASALVHPGIPLALAGSSIAYTKPVQNFLVHLAASRPKEAPRVANYLRQLTATAGLAGGALPQEFR